MYGDALAPKMKLDEMQKRLQTLLRCILDEEDEEEGGKDTGCGDSGLLCLRSINYIVVCL